MAGLTTVLGITFVWILLAVVGPQETVPERGVSFYSGTEHYRIVGMIDRPTIQPVDVARWWPAFMMAGAVLGHLIARRGGLFLRLRPETAEPVRRSGDRLRWARRDRLAGG